MRHSRIHVAAFTTTALVLALVCGITLPRAQANDSVMKGWISDKDCATGRANGGAFTGTNPDCAKNCIAKGAATVLIVPDQKLLLTIDNPAIAKSNIGNYVEVTGTVDAKARTLHIAGLRLLRKGVAMCDAPKSNK